MKYIVLFAIYFIISITFGNFLPGNANETKEIFQMNKHKFGVYGDESFLFAPFDSVFTEPYHINPNHRFWKPNCICDEFTALGDLSRDGYKMVCQRLFMGYQQKDCLVYSLGSNNNFDFEYAVHALRPDCEIYTFDMDYFHAPSFVNFTQAKLGLCSECKTIKKLMKELGHEGRRVDLFKCDIEGTESVPVHQPHDIQPPFNQILLEIHDPSAEHMKMMDKHKDDFCLAGMNINVACLTCMELVFVNKMFMSDMNIK